MKRLTTHLSHLFTQLLLAASCAAPPTADEVPDSVPDESAQELQGVLTGLDCELVEPVGSIQEISDDLTSQRIGHYANGVGPDCPEACTKWAEALDDGSTASIGSFDRFYGSENVTTCEVTRSAPVVEKEGCDLVEDVTPWRQSLPVTAPDGAVAEGVEGYYATGTGDKEACASECALWRDRLAAEHQVSQDKLDVVFEDITVSVARGDFVCTVGRTIGATSSELEFGGFIGVRLSPFRDGPNGGKITNLSIGGYFGKHRWKDSQVWASNQPWEPTSASDDVWRTSDPLPLTTTLIDDSPIVVVNVGARSVTARREPKTQFTAPLGQWRSQFDPPDRAGAPNEFSSTAFATPVSLQIKASDGAEAPIVLESILPPVLATVDELDDKVTVSRSAQGVPMLEWIPRKNMNLAQLLIYAEGDNERLLCAAELYNGPDAGAKTRTIEVTPECKAAIDSAEANEEISVSLGQFYVTDVEYDGRRLRLFYGETPGQKSL